MNEELQEVTYYDDIFTRALFYIKDREIRCRDDMLNYKIFEGYLRAAENDFRLSCRCDLNDRDDEGGYYRFVMGAPEMEILALGVAYQWVSHYVLDNKFFENHLNTRDYTLAASPASMLNSLKSLRGELSREFQSRISAYSYEGEDLAAWTR